MKFFDNLLGSFQTGGGVNIVILIIYFDVVAVRKLVLLPQTTFITAVTAVHSGLFKKDNIALQLYSTDMPPGISLQC
jgi:hypothetical protein